MLDLSVPWWEFVIRGFVVYTFLLLMLRLTGKRQVGQLAPMDLVLLLILSNAVQNSMNAGDNSLVGGLVSATTLIFLNWGVAYFAFRSRRVERLIDGDPIVLVRDGVIMEDVLVEEKITRAELEATLRGNGVFSVREAKLVILETNGRVSVWKPAEQT